MMKDTSDGCDPMFARAASRKQAARTGTRKAVEHSKQQAKQGNARTNPAGEALFQRLITSYLVGPPRAPFLPELVKGSAGAVQSV